MFYEIIDRALFRHTFPDGTEIATITDEHAQNPIEDWDVHPVGIYRVGRNYTVTDPYGIIEEYQWAEEERENIVECHIPDALADMREKYGPEWWNPRPDASPSDLAEHICELEHIAVLIDDYDDTIPDNLHKFEVYAQGSTYVVVIDSHRLAALGVEITPETIEANAQAAADDYAYWADGDVLHVGVTFPDGTTDELGGVYQTIWTETDAAQYIMDQYNHNPQEA